MGASPSWLRVHFPAPTPGNDRAPQLLNLVEQLIDRVADLFEPSGLRHGQVRIRDIPNGGRDLVIFCATDGSFFCFLPFWLLPSA
jgi:hypothetical protein